MSNKKSSGIGLTTTLFLIFLILKLTETIDWSWWWVTSPLWITFFLTFLLIFLVFLIVTIALFFGGSLSDVKQKIEKIIEDKKNEKK
jgi:hypothetical protein